MQIVPGSDNAVAIELISTHIRRQLKERGTRLRERLAVAGPRSLKLAHNSPNPDTIHYHPNVAALSETPQLKVRVTYTRDSTTTS